ncbi:MAG: YkgJ family cysteine cluster protein [Deltaproteobacteria bacterium]|nr:YkgJ family cysteine cluster protein [Deltaproteobacteria bacterium]
MTVGELCVACGICCRGAFFRYALLSDEEVGRLHALGIPTATRRNGQKAIRLGCAALRGTACTLYEVRPRVCHAYFCQLAFRLRDGLVTPEAARQIVAETQAVLAQLEAELPPRAEGDPPSAVERAYQYGLSSGPALLRRAEALFREHYLGPGQP